MKAQQEWQPSFIVFDPKTNDFVLNRNAVYAGSWHVVALQWESYRPLFDRYIKGKFLDCGCGRVPYFEFLKSRVSLYYTIDREVRKGTDHLDEKIDLNLPFELKEKEFDSILLSDVLAHVKYPAELVKQLANHLTQGGHLIITTPFIYWASEHPYNYFNPSDSALRLICEDAGLEIVHLEPYGGRADVLLDTLNKSMTGRFSHRLFLLLASVLKSSRWYKRSNEKSGYSYALGYTLAARKK